VLRHVARLWGFDVILESVDARGTVLNTYECKCDKRLRDS
jgi:stage V sporulation protein R